MKVINQCIMLKIHGGLRDKAAIQTQRQNRNLNPTEAKKEAQKSLAKQIANQLRVGDSTICIEW